MNDTAAPNRRSWLWTSWILLVLVQLDYLVLNLFDAGDRVTNPTLAFDRWLFAGAVPTTWLQHRLYHATPSWWDYLVSAVYFTHFLVWPILAIWLWRVSRDGFRRLMRCFLPLTLAGYVTYAVVPVAPPWLAALRGDIHAPVHRVVVGLVDHVGLGQLASAFPEDHITLATVGAIPSLHAAYPLLYLLLYARSGGRRGLPLLTAYVLAMAFTLVYAGEHYVGDIFLGWLYALVTVLVLDRGGSWRRHDRQPARIHLQSDIETTPQ